MSWTMSKDAANIPSIRLVRYEIQILRWHNILEPNAQRVKSNISLLLKVNYHPLCSMNKFVRNKAKLPQDGAQVFPYMGWLAIMWPSERVTW